MRTKKTFPRWLKVGLKIVAVLMAVFVCVWLVLSIYINSNKKELLGKVAEQINNQLKGDLQIKEMDLVLFSNFPDISVSLEGVTLRDSLWHHHHHDLLQAERIYVDLGILSLVKGHAVIRQLRVNDGKVHVYTDSNGYSNTWALQLKEKKEKKKKGGAEIENLSLQDVGLVIENKAKFKYFSLQLHEVQGKWKNKLDGWKVRMQTDLSVKQFCFNTTRGSFLQGKDIKGVIVANFDKGKQLLSLQKQALYIDETVVAITGEFDFSTKPSHFQLTISTDNVLLRDATAMLTKPISSKINLVNLDEPISAKAIIIGKMQYRDTPWVRAYWTVKNNTLHTPAGSVTQTSFNGVYTNQVVHGQTFGDENSAINVYNMKGSMYEIPFRFDSVAVTNLKRPVFSGHIRSKFELPKINVLTAGNTFNFSGGIADVDLIYKGGLSENDMTIPYIYGHIVLQKASVAYTPKNISFTNCNGALFFNGNDLLVNNLQLTRNKSTVKMKGGVKDFLNFFYTTPDKALIDWHITSNYVDVNDYLPFVTKSKYAMSLPKKRGTTTRYISRLNRFLEMSSVHMDVNIAQLGFRQFRASAVKADILLKKADILVNNIKLNHANGVLQARAELFPSHNGTPFNMTADIAHVNVQQLFHAFENFGQKAIEENNIRGILSAAINMKGSLSSKGGLTPYSLNGNCDFHLVNGALVNFEPLERVGKFVFRRRNLSNISFKKIENNLQVQGSKIYIKPMAIESSVLNIFLKGVYSLTTGTNIEMEIPIRNPQKDELIEDKELKEKRSRRGIILYLKAEDGEDGKIKIHWNKEGKKITTE